MRLLLWFLLQPVQTTGDYSTTINQGSGDFWGWVIGGAVIAAIAGTAWYKMRQIEKGCGSAGCIDGGYVFPFRDVQQAPQQQPQTIYLQQQPSVYQVLAQPQVIYVQQSPPMYLQSPPPQIHYLSAPQQAPQMHPQAPPAAHYLPAAPAHYQPSPQPAYPSRQPMSYYPGYSPDLDPYIEEYQPVYSLPARQPVGQLPPARASAIDEARRRFESERNEMKRRR